MSLKLLVVDDHPLFREGISSALRASGQDFDFIQAAPTREGIELAEGSGDFDAVLLDVALPGMNGFVAIREFRLRCPLLPVVIVSASTNASNARRALSAGAAGFIPKSTPTAQVIEALREVLAGGVYLPPALGTECLPRRLKKPRSRKSRPGAAGRRPDRAPDRSAGFSVPGQGQQGDRGPTSACPRKP